MTPRTKSALLFLAKAGVATALITWLVRSGSLDFRLLGVVFAQPKLLFLNMAVFFGNTAICAHRWRILLGLAGARLPFWRAVQLQLTGMFFNTVVPGNVGGDVVKALYVARDNAPEKRTGILLIVLVDRLVGLAGLILFANLVTVPQAATLAADPQLRQVFFLVALLGAGVILGPALLVLLLRRGGPTLEAKLNGPTKLAKLLTQLVAALRLLTSDPWKLAQALGLAILAHAAAMSLFVAMTHAIVDANVSFTSIATVYPLGFLTIVIPVAPAGLGVGHVAFDRLFGLIGLKGGADVFNVYLIGQLSPCLLGVIPYVLLKRAGALPTADSGKETPP